MGRLPWRRVAALLGPRGASLLVALAIAWTAPLGGAAAAERPPDPSPPDPPGGAGGERGPWLACALDARLAVDFEGNQAPYRVEWRRCGPKQASWRGGRSGIDYPVHYVLVRREGGPTEPLMVFDNAEEPSISYIGRVQRMKLTKDGKEQLMILRYVYGTGAGWEMCLLGWVGGQFRCWETPDFGGAVDRVLRGDEARRKTLLRSVTEKELLVEALIYDKENDPNCCPSRGSVFLELVPAQGRFEVGRVWRVPPGGPN